MSSRSKSAGELGQIVMTSSGWYYTSIQSNVVLKLFAVLKWVSIMTGRLLFIKLFINKLDLCNGKFV